MVKVTGLFFSEKTIDRLIRLESDMLASFGRTRLVRNPNSFHCTFKFLPTIEEIMRFNEIVGETGTVFLCGYGESTNNTGFRVFIPEELGKYYTNCFGDGTPKIPHITMSLSETGRAVDTCTLHFSETGFNPRIPITGRFGFLLNGDREPSYERQKVLK